MSQTQAIHYSSETSVYHIVRLFETLTPDTVLALGTLYASTARFKDPFNDVNGWPEFHRIVRQMFLSLKQPRSVIMGCIVQGQQCFLTWEFLFEFKRFKQGQPQCTLGGSHLVLFDGGLIALHRDYWDAADELYEKWPVLGGLMRWLKARGNS